eukprot:CAMPEP_0184318930 /NCGR_PEP_ID=MMETSP1049-20130417/105672_1 /TAXON_ID=77928 /ORGANISM="Proteomonas sulcata, Strain CCMP704" /LENGTH=144 /DNA_ID=CAMNT_0026638893 /DNA_START=59 /DNA_END=493 /DNA_ORIENTATION=-
MKDMNSWEKTFLNNMLGTPVILALAAAAEPLSEVVETTLGLSLMPGMIVLLSCVMGLGISMSGTKCREVLSATSFDVLGNSTKYLTLAMSMIFLNSKPSTVSLIGVIVALTGGAFYSPAGKTFCDFVTGANGNKERQVKSKKET